MAAYDNLPWLNSSDQFLQAIELGSRNAARIANARNSGGDGGGRRAGGGGGFPRMIGGGYVPDQSIPAPGSVGTGPAPVIASADPASVAANEEAMAQARANQIANLDPWTRNAFYPQRPNIEEQIKREKVYEIGGNVVAIDPATGKNRMLYEAPPQASKEPTFEIPMSKDLMGKTATSVRATPSQIKAQFDTLPEFARTNDVTRFAMNIANGNTNAAPAATVNSTGLQEGQRVRNSKTGQLGIVRNGQVVPIEEEVQETERFPIILKGQ